MRLKIEEWKINKVFQLKDKIDPKPQYQRGGVWLPKKNKLLIDSILRGMDIPKLYLREIVPDAGYDYEVADGQQRLRAIWGFRNNEFELGDCEIDEQDLSKLNYGILNDNVDTKKFIDDFNNFRLTISIIQDATDDEVRTLFARLQMGSALNQPELRNAVASNIGYAINMMVTNHPFFVNSAIAESRFKRQDYLAHVITLIHYNNEVNLKADAIMNMYEDLSIRYPQTYFTKANKILKWMNEINSRCNHRIKNKWAFVDFFWFLYNNYSEIQNIDYEKLAQAFIRFENKRLLYNSDPKPLIESEESSIRDRYLYDYILSFNYSGGYMDNISTRARVFEHKFSRYLNLQNG